ncbi:hypothetical protein [Xanthomonas campestris]|uniref:Uncharacterized protein n=1 Tax=Xanthomonas campestris pv. papavericola TaxID=487881 RepID=A0AAJ2X5B9_XANCA|nr:hypothetical protein [Xanthomonas campestris]MEC3888909.1 hypothetical protein [Xanthomonas campestris pv. papavericola]
MSLTDRIIEMQSRLPEPDPAAFSDMATREVEDTWLATASPSEQTKAMRLWFLERYCDPQIETPYNSDAGAYFFLRGGPYDPNDVLQERFEDVVTYEVIAELVNELHQEVGDEWAPTELTAEDEWDDVFVDRPDGPIQRLEERLAEFRTMTELNGSPMTRILLRQLVYAAVITTLETFLWEQAAYWLEQDASAIGRLIQRDSHTQQRLAQLGDDSEGNRATIVVELNQGLKTKVWHRWEKNGRFLGHLLGITMPSYAALEAPTKIRHDIAHRGGKDTEHNPHNISQEHVDELIAVVTSYAQEIQRGIAGRET